MYNNDKKNRKIALIAIPIVILGAVSLTLFQSETSILSQSETKSDKISIESVPLDSLNLSVIGISDAPVTIIAFNDYQCRDCKTWYNEEYQTISENLIETRKAKMVFIDSISLGIDSILMSEATYCANEQEKYSEYQEILFNSQQEIDGWAKSEQLKEFAMNLELDMESFEECLDSRKYEDKVLSNIDFAKKLGVDKIPIFKIINSEGLEHILKGGLSSEVFEEIVDQLQ